MTRAGPLDIVNVEHVAGSAAELRGIPGAGAQSSSCDGVEVAVAGLSDLIRMKRAAGRDHDLADIEVA